jgi:hypothetical protein
MDTKRSPLENFTFAIYEPKYYEETLELLTKSYMLASPFVKNLGLTEQHMRNEFKRHLDTGYYGHGVLAIHRESGEVKKPFIFILDSWNTILGFLREI